MGEYEEGINALIVATNWLFLCHNPFLFIILLLFYLANINLTLKIHGIAQQKQKVAALIGPIKTTTTNKRPSGLAPPHQSAFFDKLILVLFLLFWHHLSGIMAQSDSAGESPTVLVNVGLIGPDTLPSEQLSTMANQQLHALNLTQRDVFHISVKSYNTNGVCPTGVDSEDASAHTLDLMYNTNISALFGPICSDDLSLVGRTSSTMDILQFNFWREFRLNSTLAVAQNTVIQISTMSTTNLGRNIAATLALFNWRRIALVTCADCVNHIDQYQLEGVGLALKQTLIDQKVEILAHIKAANLSSVDSLVTQLTPLKKNSRVILAYLGSTLSVYVPFMKALQQLGMDTDEYAPVLSISRYRPTQMELPWIQPNSDGTQKTDAQMLKLFDRTILVANDFYNGSQVLDFANQIGIQMSLTNPIADEDNIRLLQAIQLYECFWTYALTLWRAYQKTMDLNVHRNGTMLRVMTAGQTIQGPFGPITLNGQYQRLAPYRVFLIRTGGQQNMFEMANISLVRDCSAVNSVFVSAQKGSDGTCIGLLADLLPGNQHFLESFPLDVPSCGFNGEYCDQKGTIIVVVSVMVAICVGFIVFLCIRKVKKGETTQMPYYIPEQMISFVDVDGYGGSSSMSIHSLQQQEFQKEMMNNHNHNNHQQASGIGMESHQQLNQLGALIGTSAIYSKHIGTVEQSFVIIECYRLKEKLSFDKRDMQLLFQMKQMVHDNINPFIGLCVERPTELMVIWRHCFRGTLEDLLFMNKGNAEAGNKRIGASIASLTSEDGVGAAGGGAGPNRAPQRDILDNNFKSAFVRDIIKGLDFIHSSSIGYHGSLTSSHCLIDSHWILKLSGFGTSRLLYKWRHNGTMSNGDGASIQPLIPNSALHYYSPEVRSAIRSAVLRNKTEDLEFSNEDGQAQDMYAFGAILYEILYRRRIMDLEDRSEGLIVEDEAGETAGGLMDAMEDDVGIFSAVAEERLPIFPEFPGEDGTDSTKGDGTSAAERVHPDLVALMRKCFGRIDQRPDANMARKITDATLKMPGSLVDNFLKNMEQYTNNLENMVREQTGRLEEEQQKAEQILLELLPKSVVDELRMGRRVEPQFYGSVTIMYSDIVGFTSLCSESGPMEVVNLLNGMFRAFDEAIDRHQAYKVETIGDAYMVASGVPEQMDSHVREIASVALMQREFLCHYEIPHRPGQFLHCRWGFNSGSVFTGVVGITAPRYCVFGTAVTIAAKMENSGQPDRIQMTLKSYQLLNEQFPEFRCMPRGGVRLDGVGTLLTYWLDGIDTGATTDRTEGSRSSGGIQQVPLALELPLALAPTSPLLTPPPPPTIFV